MNATARKKIKRWAYVVAGYASAIATVIQADPNFNTLTWRELLSRVLKAAPFVLAGHAARSMLFKTDDDDQKPSQ